MDTLFADAVAAKVEAGQARQVGRGRQRTRAFVADLVVTEVQGGQVSQVG
jgi:hypothetical protein